MIYIHIPYCRTRCTYCGFYSELLPRGGGVPDFFIDALLAEIEAFPCERNGKCDTLYLGGGTPSLLSTGQIQRIVSALGGGPWEEFTMEVNPDDITEEYACALLCAGVSRISMGVQSADDCVLHRMGRRHDSSRAQLAYRTLREAGFDNISLDFIIGFPSDNPQRLSSEELQSRFARTLDFFVSAGGLPEHLSVYQLSVEEGSGLEKMLDRRILSLPSDEECRREYDAVCRELSGRGYEHYEISNWAKPGLRSRHNSAYWHHIPYTGYGPGAHSLVVEKKGQMMEYRRYWNRNDLRSYVRASRSGGSSPDALSENAGVDDVRAAFAAIRGSETLTPEQVRTERIMLGLRTAEGVDGMTIPEDQWFVSDSIIASLV